MEKWENTPLILSQMVKKIMTLPRDGIGNVEGKGSETHPSELAEGLNGTETCEVEEED